MSGGGEGGGWSRINEVMNKFRYIITIKVYHTQVCYVLAQRCNLLLIANKHKSGCYIIRIKGWEGEGYQKCCNRKGLVFIGKEKSADMLPLPTC
jgi:hypothetical protein